MKKTNRYFLILILPLFFLKTYSQENNSNYIVNNFFKLYENENSDKAFEYIFSTNRLISKEDIKITKDKVKKYKALLGEYYGKKLFIKQNVKEFVEIHIYILKYKHQPLKFTFTFYKPNESWKIQNFKISEDFIEEMEKSIN